MIKSFMEAACESGYINTEQKSKAEAYKMQANASDEIALRDMKFMTEEQIAELYSKMYGYKQVSEPEIKNVNFVSLFTSGDLIRYGFIPDKDGNLVTIYTSKPGELLYAEDIVRDKGKYKGVFEYAISTSSAVRTAIDRVFAEGGGEDAEFEGEDVPESNIYNVTEEDISQIVTLVNRILREAIENKASDIHFEPQEDGLYIRFRYDGTLKVGHKYPLSIAGQVANRIKTMAGIDVTTNKIIQDGSVRLSLSDKMVDLRISVIPSLYGENLVIRILDQNKMSLDISAIGFSKEDEDKFKKLIHTPQGIILFTGPTGSGKSTSIYAGLSMLNTEDRCIITFEDPVEYRIPGIVQIEINPHQDVTYPNAMKSGLRQDIDTALLGEIRDEETARIAFDAANTGHLVISTLHTNTAASAILRMAQLGVEPYVIAQSLIAVINQRLARRICPYCREEYVVDADSPYRKVLGGKGRKIVLTRGRGCRKCGFTGYMGRVAIIEFLVVDEEIRHCIECGGTTYEIEKIAVRNGMKKIHDDGIEKVFKGITTIDEIHRTVFFDKI